ncbi:nucleotidyl transferase AbiEii/AbiGii toxin family protein [Rhodococcus cerastii]|nr:nucleotidyl transferase AbiEii/AbiGii toxin family protein [Rhodococcus cerastii]
MIDIVVASTSNAADLGYRALADLATAAEGLDYRVVGGHMVQLLLHAYPTPEAQKSARATSDADAGIERPLAIGQDIHHRLLELGYTPLGNRYEKKSADSPPESLAVDLLVPRTSTEKTAILGDRAFDAIPGLNLAMAAEPTMIAANIRLTRGQYLTFTVPVPNPEAALVLKALAWKSRNAPKDLTDISSLLELAYLHSASLVWKLNQADHVCKGDRRDAAHALIMLKTLLTEQRIPPAPSRSEPARMAALIHRLVLNPQAAPSTIVLPK